MELVNNKRVRIADDLVQAAEMLRQGVVVESVAWRLADAAADFVTLVEAEGGRDVQGVHNYSGKGGKLVRRVKP